MKMAAIQRPGVALVFILFLLLFPHSTRSAPAFPLSWSAATEGLPVGVAQAGPGLVFVENLGQFDARARFAVRGASTTIWLSEDGIWLTMAERRTQTDGPVVAARDRHPTATREDEVVSARAVNLRQSFAGSNPRPRLEPLGRRETVLHYYVGNRPDRWRANVPTWSGVRYVDLYPGLDLEVSGAAQGWSWRLVKRETSTSASRQPVASSLDLSSVRLRVEGADVVEVGGNRLLMRTTVGDATLPLLTIEGAQLTALPRIQVAGTERGYEVVGPFASDFGSEDIRLSNVSAAGASDLVFSTFLGTGGWEQGRAIAADSSGAVYVTGWTMSADFRTTPGLDTSLGGNADTFVAKLKPDGSDLVYVTYLGGSCANSSYPSLITESGNAIDVDSARAVSVAGHTYSSDFPTTPGAFDTTFNSDPACGGVSPPRTCSDAFVARLDSSGTLAYASYLGGSHYTIPDGPLMGGEDSATGREEGKREGETGGS